MVWEVQYLLGAPAQRFTTANEIHIPVGQPVDIELRSLDVIHSFWDPERLMAKLTLSPAIPISSAYRRINPEFIPVLVPSIAALSMPT